MPEGPSIVILADAVREFEGSRVLLATGNAKIDVGRISGQEILQFRTWGKHFLICFADFTVRIHFMLFGSYLINGRKAAIPRLTLAFDDGEINFYACSVKIIEGKVDKIYDWQADVMNPQWSPRRALAKIKKVPQMQICDVLLEQEIFSGVGNIIKNEVLYRVRIHPESHAGAIPVSKLREIVREARHYSFEFLEWKKNFVLKKHWLAHAKKTCKRCNLPFEKKYTGQKKRRSFFCTKCQKCHQCKP